MYAPWSDQVGIGRSIEQLGSDAVANSGREDIGGISNSQNMAGLSSFPMSRNVFIVDIPPQDQLDSLDEELCSTGESFNSADSPVPETQSGDGCVILELLTEIWALSR